MPTSKYTYTVVYENDAETGPSPPVSPPWA